MIALHSDHLIHNRKTRGLNETVFPVMFLNEVRDIKDVLKHTLVSCNCWQSGWTLWISRSRWSCFILWKKIHSCSQAKFEAFKKKKVPFVLMHKEPTINDTPQDLTTRQYYIEDASPVTCDIQTSPSIMYLLHCFLIECGDWWCVCGESTEAAADCHSGDQLPTYYCGTGSNSARSFHHPSDQGPQTEGMTTLLTWFCFLFNLLTAHHLLALAH